tara:strand:+ start:99 stop:218 length:120 start_codon:yes stop_codon:yes gene_type:complete
VDFLVYQEVVLWEMGQSEKVVLQVEKVVEFGHQMNQVMV